MKRLKNIQIKEKRLKKIVKRNKTIVEYIESQMKTFEELPFNEVDSLIFSQMSYMNLDRVVSSFEDSLGQWIEILSLYRAEEFDGLVFKTLNPPLNRELLRVICASPRYRTVLMNYHADKYDKESELQFSAVTFKLPTGEILVTYRGTDATFIGWKEDFNMVYKSPVPSQIEAERYLESVASRTDGDIIVQGHSKGGNLAVYSGVNASESVQERIVTIYDLDGPGFPMNFYENNKHKEVEHKIKKIIPEGSVVGILMESVGKIKIIKSNSVGLRQHEPFTWKIVGKRFMESEEIANSSKRMDRTINTWVENLSIEQRQMLVETLFTIISVSKAEHIQEFASYAIKEKDMIREAIKDMDEETSNAIKEMIMTLVRMSISINGDEERRGFSIINKD